MVTLGICVKHVSNYRWTLIYKHKVKDFWAFDAGQVIGSICLTYFLDFLEDILD